MDPTRAMRSCVELDHDYGYVVWVPMRCEPNEADARMWAFEMDIMRMDPTPTNDMAGKVSP